MLQRAGTDAAESWDRVLQRAGTDAAESWD